MENKIVLSDEQRRKLIDETNLFIDERNMVALDVLGLSERVASIGLYQEITASREDKYLFGKMRGSLLSKRNKLNNLNHRIEVNKRILGIKPKKISLIKTRH
jgi:hypothetical protein